MDKRVEIQKNKIIDWCKADGITCKEMPQKEGSKLFWNLHVGQPPIAIYTQKKHTDRILFQQDINFADAHKKLVNETWTIQKKNSMILQLQTNGLTWNIRQEILGGKIMTGIRQYFIHSDSSFEKHEFLEKIFRLSEIHGVTMNILSLSLGAEMNALKNVQKEKEDDNPLAG